MLLSVLNPCRFTPVEAYIAIGYSISMLPYHKEHIGCYYGRYGIMSIWHYAPISI